MYESSLTIMTVICGLALFDESASYTWGRLICIWFCVGLVCCGIFTLTVKESIKEKKEEGINLESSRIYGDQLSQVSTMTYDDKQIVRFLNTTSIATTSTVDRPEKILK